jgi:hypothetical protein
MKAVVMHEQPSYSGRRSQQLSHTQEATTSRFFSQSQQQQQQQLQRTIKSSASPFVPSFPSTAVTSFGQRSSPRAGSSGRSFKNSSGFDKTNSCQVASNSELPHLRFTQQQLSQQHEQPSPFLANSKLDQPSPFLHAGKEEQPSPLLMSSSSLHGSSSRQPDVVRSSNFKLSMNSSFDMVNPFASNSSSTNKEKMMCKQEPVFLVSRASHTTTNAGAVTRQSNTFPSPVVCRIPMTDTSMCVIQPSFITTADTANMTISTPYMNPAPPVTDMCAIIPQNICVHLPYGICSNNELSCSRCYREDMPLRTVVPAVVPAASIGRLHLSQNLHMTYTTNGLTVSTVPTSSLHHTTLAASAVFHASS